MTKRALLIGVDEYSSANVPDLKGCVNDVTAIGAVLTDVYGFEDENLTLLTSVEKTTRKRILDELELLVSRTEDGDVVVFYYSGHGSQVPDKSGDDGEDHLDETIVPSDSGRDGEEVGDIVDDEIHSYITALAERTGNVSFVFDSCHSGSVARGLVWTGDLQDLDPSFVPRAIPAAESRPAEPLRIYPTPGGLRGAGTGMVRNGDAYLTIAACADDQTAKETVLGDKRRGVFSFHLEAALKSSSSDPVESIFEQVKKDVKGTAAHQDPVFEAPDGLAQATAFGGANPKAAEPEDDAEKEKEEEEAPLPSGGGGGDDNGKKEEAAVPPEDPHEWDPDFAAKAARLVVKFLVLGGLAIGGLVWWVLDRGPDTLEVSLIVVISLIAVGLVLALLGAYIGLLEARGRARAREKAFQEVRAVQVQGRDVEGATVAEPSSEFVKALNGIVEQLGKMPTARTLIVIGGVAFVAATAFAWHVLPDLGEQDAPEIVTQPKAAVVEPSEPALFRVVANGEDLHYAWELNGTAIDGAADAPKYAIAETALAEDGDLYGVTVTNDEGETVSEDVKLTVEEPQ